MGKVIDWFKQSNRWKHLISGILVGIGGGSFYGGVYAGVMVAAALEFKDWAHGSMWDWLDLGITVVGALIGAAIYLI